MKTIITHIILLLTGLNLSAQSISDETLSVDKDYQSAVYKSKALIDAFNLKANGIMTTNHVAIDSMISIGLPNSKIDISVEPLSYQQEAINNDNKGHLMFTKGTINDLAIQGALFHRVDNYFTVAAHGSYDSWNERTVSDKFQKDIEATLLANYYLTDYSQLTMQIQSNNLRRGLFSDLNQSEQSDTISLNSFVAYFDYSTFRDEPNALNYELGITFNTTVHDNLNVKEHLWTISPMVKKAFSSTLSLKLSSESYLSSNLGMSTPFVSNNELSLRINSSKYTLSIGGVLNKKPNSLSIYPSIRSNFYFDANNILSARVSEELHYLGLNAVTQNNPYINQDFISPTVTRIRVHSVALTNPITNRVKVKAQLSRNYYFNDVNWINVTEEPGLFLIEEVDYDSWNARAAVTVEPNPMFNLSVSLEKNIYKSGNVLYYRPEHKAEIKFVFATEDQKLKFSIQNTLSDRQIIGLDSDNESIRSDFRVDVGMNISYRPLEMLSVEFTANNLLNNQFEALRGYNVFGRNLSASALLKF